MTIPFSVFFERLRQATDIGTQTDMARALGVNRSAITQAKARNAVPAKWVLALARRYTLSPDWLEFGTVEMPPTRTSCAGWAIAGRAAPGGDGPELFYIPKVAARLCAGGGSFEVEAVPVDEYPFPRQWLARMGRPSAMVFMDVVGDSMTPEICDGDMVLVDQSQLRIVHQAVLAVGVEDGIYIKRVEQFFGGVILHSENPQYSDMRLYGDELQTFRVLGRVVWLCRSLR